MIEATCNVGGLSLVLLPDGASGDRGVPITPCAGCGHEFHTTQTDQFSHWVGVYGNKVLFNAQHYVLVGVPLDSLGNQVRRCECRCTYNINF